MTHTGAKIKVKGQSVRNTHPKQMNKHKTNERMDTTDCSNIPANMVGTTGATALSRVNVRMKQRVDYVHTALV